MQAKRVLVALILIALIGSASAATYYVSPTGGGTQDGLSKENAFSMDKAKSYADTHLNEEITFLLLSGNYGPVQFPYNVGKNRTGWDKKVLWKPADGETPVFRQLDISGQFNRYFEFDGIQILQTGAIKLNGNMVRVKNSSRVRLKNLRIEGNGYIGLMSLNIPIGQPGWEEYGIALGTSVGVYQEDILIEGCEITRVLNPITTGGRIKSGLVIRNNTIHFGSNSAIGLAFDGAEEAPIVEGNKIFDQENPGDQHGGSGISIRVQPAIIRGNIVHDWGGTHPITQYWEAFDGGVTFTGALADTNNFTKGETVTQADTGATGEVYKSTTSAGTTTLVIRRFQENNIFTSGKDIRADDGTGILTNVVMDPEVRPYGGYKNMVYENNLVYDSRNEAPLQLTDIGDNLVFRNNTIIGRWTKYKFEQLRGQWAYRWRYSGSAGFGFAPGTDASTANIYNNIFVGETGFSGSEEQLSSLKENYNIFWTLLVGDKRPDSLNGPDSKIVVIGGYFGDIVPGFSADYFEASGKFFVGGADFDKYSYQYPDGTTHKANLDDAYYPVPTSIACPSGNPSLAAGEYIGALACEGIKTCTIDSQCDTGKKCCNNTCRNPTCTATTGCATGQTCTSPNTCNAACQNTQCSEAQLLDYISQWKQGSLGMAALMQKIAAWKAGSGC